MKTWKIRFGLGQMMFGIFWCSGWLALLSAGFDWSECVLGAAAILVVIGLGSQAWDQWRNGGEPCELDVAERWRRRMEVAWRVALLLIIAAYFVVEHPEVRQLIYLHYFEPNHDLSFDFSSANAMAFQLAMLIAISCGSTRSAPRSEYALWRRILTPIWWLAAALLCFIVWTYETHVDGLVYIAVTGMEVAQPAWLFEERVADGVPLLAGVRETRFYRITMLAGLTVPANFLLTFALTRQKAVNSWRGMLILALLAVSWGCAGYYAVWVYTGGLFHLSPMFAEGMTIRPFRFWCTPVLLLTMMVTVMAYRVATNQQSERSTMTPPWRVHPKRYFHERLPVPLLVITGIVLDVIADLGQTAYELDILCYLLLYIANLIQLALLIQCVHRTTVLITRRCPAQHVISSFSAARLVFAWCVFMTTTVISLPVIAWVSFAVWLKPF